MKPLSELLDDELVDELKRALELGTFPGISLKHAMEFLLTDGIFPESDLPLESFYALERWVHAKRPS
jgi:hypothetical protein